MKSIREILPKGKEAAFASGLLLLFAAALFLSPDPVWTMWAAQMAVGVLYVPIRRRCRDSRRVKPCGSCRRPDRSESSSRRRFWHWGIKTSCKPRSAYRSLPWEETDGVTL